jgi:tmRNA-binding protein
MRRSKLTKKEKKNGKRKLLIPSKEIQELMQPVTREDFESVVTRAIPPASQPDPEEKQTSAH